MLVVGQEAQWRGSCGRVTRAPVATFPEESRPRNINYGGRAFSDLVPTEELDSRIVRQPTLPVPKLFCLLPTRLNDRGGEWRHDDTETHGSLLFLRAKLTTAIAEHPYAALAAREHMEAREQHRGRATLRDFVASGFIILPQLLSTETARVFSNEILGHLATHGKRYRTMWVVQRVDVLAFRRCRAGSHDADDHALAAVTRAALRRARP